jgi:hypothetical protein
VRHEARIPALDHNIVRCFDWHNASHLACIKPRTRINTLNMGRS